MLNINLVPEAKKQQKKIQKTNLTVTIVAISIGAVFLFTILIFLGIKVSKATSSKNLTKNIEKTEKELKNYKKLEDTVISLQRGLEGIKKINENSSKWTTFLKELEKATPKDIAIEKIDIKDSVITMDLEGSNVESLARYVDSFKAAKIKDKNLFKNIEVPGYTRSEKGGVSFTSKMELDKEALWQ